MKNLLLFGAAVFPLVSSDARSQSVVVPNVSCQDKHSGAYAPNETRTQANSTAIGPTAIGIEIERKKSIRAGLPMGGRTTSWTPSIADQITLNASKMVAQGAFMAASLQQRFARIDNVQLDFGVKADELQIVGCSIPANSTALHCPGAAFVPSDVGKSLTVRGAGAANERPDATIIAAYVDPYDVTLSKASIMPAPLYYDAAVAPATSTVTSSYKPGDSIAVAGGSSYTKNSGKITVAATQLASAAIASAGSGGTTGACILTGTTGAWQTPGGAPFQINGTILGGMLSALGSILAPGAYSTNPSTLAAEPVTSNCGLTGATLRVIMGPRSYTLPTRTQYGPPPLVGAYTIFPTSPAVTTADSGTGAGAMVTLTKGTTGLVTYGTNNTTALQNALNADRGKAYLFVPHGNYLTGPLAVHSNTDIKIDGALLLVGGTQGSMFTLDPNAERVSFHGSGTLDGNWLDNTAGHGSPSRLSLGIWSGDAGAVGSPVVTKVSITHLLITHFVNAPASLSGSDLFLGDGLRMTNSENSPGFVGSDTTGFVADDVYVSGITDDVGFSIYNGASDGVIANSTFTNNLDGLSFFNDSDSFPASHNVIVLNNRLYNNLVHGMVLGQGDNTRTVLHANITIVKNDIYQNGQSGAGYGLVISNCRNCLVICDRIHNDSNNSVRSTSGITLSPNSTGTIIKGVTIYDEGLPGSNSAGISDAREFGVQITGTSIYDDRPAQGMKTGISGTVGSRSQFFDNHIRAFRPLLSH
ncbi:right-handed parallel beta-helix repeat-containing protein [Acidisoma sp. S159]|uniref:right-handed parallel beta-helix repeat-containing protein n=1 Tax=Acidisoma sp. S159 TaxID=1747225 RepID=UPI00131DB5DD|nr:right-handed parallel beta-helix repeat-containing protein [Acidisoma sp. S159]